MIIEQDGKQIEVFTAEEIETQKAEAVKAATEATTKELETAKADLAKLTSKDMNFETMRLKVESLEKKAETAKQEALAEFEESGRKKMANDAIGRLSDGDEELKKKMEFHYSKLGREAKTDEEVKKAVRDSFVLARQGEATPDAINAAFTSGGGAPVMPPKTDPNRPALTDNQKSFIRAMYPGMTDEQIKELDSKAKPAKVGALDGNFQKTVV